MNPDEQLDILLRGALFADEVEGAEGAPPGEEVQGNAAAGARSLSDVQGISPTDLAAASPVAARTLREQMTFELRERLREGRPLRVYLGVDPTSTSLHIGHLVPVQKLRVFQQLGHQVIFLIGDYTGLIGDPTGQKSERKRFTHEQLRSLAQDYQRQAFRILDPEKTEVRYNGEWLSRLSFADLVEIAAIFPLKWVVSRRDFQDRLARGESLRLHETLYCLMQGYDAYALDCDVQIGGYDQYLNMLAGRWIQEHFGKKPHIIWTFPLLMGTDGRKMSKSYGNSINVLDTAEDMYGKTMRISDALIPSYIDLATDLVPAEADALKDRLAAPGVNPMDVKKEVAANLVRQYFSAAEAVAAAERFRATIQDKEVPDDVPEIPIPEELRGRRIPWPDLLVALPVDGRPLVASKGEMRRLMAQGGFYVEQEQVRDAAAAYEPRAATLIRLGKRRYARLIQAP
jgi:tyrosyl-tRNA synthetase